MDDPRSELCQHLVDALEPLPDCIACWEGGSAATATLDKYSDLDLVVCVTDGAKEACFEKIGGTLDAIAKIAHRWRLPEPTWHGHGQCLYRLDNTPEYFFLDIVIMEESSARRFQESERHGQPLVHFDKQDFIRSCSADTEGFRTKRSQRREEIAAAFPFYKAIVTKEILRERPVDALAFYRKLVDLLVEAWGMQYRPLRYDFGLRYTDRDFPTDRHDQLREYCFVANLNDIRDKLPGLDQDFHAAIGALSDRV